MLRQQLSNLSRVTTSTLKYASSSTANLFSWSLQDPGIPSQQLVEFWIAETQRGLDAILDDRFDFAESILSKHCAASPFHAVGYALMAYVEAMLGFEVEKIQLAASRIASAEELVRQWGKRIRKQRTWRSRWYRRQQEEDDDDEEEEEEEEEEESLSKRRQSSSSSSNGSFEPVSISFFSDSSTASSSSSTTAAAEKEWSSSSSSSPVEGTTMDLQCDLLQVNCMLMSATIQFLRNSWLDYMKAAYRLRKAYKMYEQLFEAITGQKTGDYAAMLRRKRAKRLPRKFGTASSWTERRFSLFNLSSSARKASLDNIRASFGGTPSRSSFSLYEDRSHHHRTTDSTVESGVCFGIGLFSLIFSLLPPKVNKILNTLGFHSSRPFALHVLQRSYESQGLYSSLSALTLLIYYTNLSLFIHPRLLPSSLNLENARAMLDHMKVKFPNSRIWELLEGKLCKMEGKPRKGVEVLRDSRRRQSVHVDITNGALKPGEPQHQQQPQRKPRLVINELAQLQALAVHEMGWGQIFLGDYFQASETFFRLESMNNWSRAFYHYIATCCMFANEQYDKAGMEFHQIPAILERKRQLGGRLLPNETFAERKIKRWRQEAQKISSSYYDHHMAAPHHHPWITRQQRQQQEKIKEHYSLLDGEILKQVVVVNPLWELIYLWNGMAQLTQSMLMTMKQQLQESIQTTTTCYSDQAILHLLLGAVTRELDEPLTAEKCFRHAIDMQERIHEDQWVIPYAMYEMAVLRSFQLQQSNNKPSDRQQLVSEAREWIVRSEEYFSQRRAGASSCGTDDDDDDYYYDDYEPTSADYHDWESRLHIRCQLLLEKLEELVDTI